MTSVAAASAAPRRVYWDFISRDGGSDQCYLFTDAFGRVLQLLLLFAALLILYLKRKLESPVRPFKVWLMDLGKQGIGSLLCHWLNIVISIFMVANSSTDDDECAIYFVVYTLDATLGIPLVLLFLRAAHATAMRLNATLLIDSGYYGDPPQWQIWGAQATAYTLVLLLMKATNLGVLAALYTPLARVSSALFATFAQHRHLELLLVMIIVPGVFNTCQFWIFDSHLKCDGEHWKYHEQPGTRDEKHRIHHHYQPQPNSAIVPTATTWNEPNLAIPL
uniref:Uncharacterized protein n=1 Tax=Globisporangium ultimum (strain ATCC 200006 / CBS 805.95 / DAOM BR144) TaxID=431595 RepID=K3WI25_GLOUD